MSLDEWRLIAADIANGATGLVIIHNADPVHGLPAGVGLADALRNENVAIISASPFIDDTSVMADLLIPDRAALEDWGDDLPDPMPGYHVYAVQQPVVNPLPDLDPRSFPDVLINAAAALGHADAMPAESYEAMIRANVEDTLGADFTDTLKNGGWWDERATGSAPSPSANLLSDIVSMAAPAQMHGSGDFQLLPFAHHTVLDGKNAHLPWAQNAPDPITTIAWQTWVEINERQARGHGTARGRRGEHYHVLRHDTGPGVPEPRYASQHRRRTHGRRANRRVRIRHRPGLPREQQRRVHPRRSRQRRRRGHLERQTAAPSRPRATAWPFPSSRAATPAARSANIPPSRYSRPSAEREATTRDDNSPSRSP